MTRSSASARYSIPLLIPWAATMLTAIAASWFGIASLFGGVPARYDAVVSLTGLTVVGLVWYTFFTRETLEHARRTAVEQRLHVQEEADGARASLATAVLAELFALTARLRNVYDHGPSNYEPDLFSHPMLDRAASSPHLFNHTAIAALAAALRHVEDVQNQLRILPELRRGARDQTLPGNDRQNFEDRRVQTQEGLRARAGWAFNRTVILQRLLTEEGGVMPTGLGDKTVPLFHRPSLLPDPFERPLDDLPPTSTPHGA